MKMDGVYTGTDRIEQVIYLQNLAANISHGSDDPSHPARDRVNYYCAHFPEELPPWFDDHDRELLIRFVEPDEDPETEYTGPPCPHGLSDPNECTLCSAGMSGAGVWPRCRHGFIPGDCPTCDQDPPDARSS